MEHSLVLNGTLIGTEWEDSLVLNGNTHWYRMGTLIGTEWEHSLVPNGKTRKKQSRDDG